MWEITPNKKMRKVLPLQTTPPRTTWWKVLPTTNKHVGDYTLPNQCERAPVPKHSWKVILLPTNDGVERALNKRVAVYFLYQFTSRE